MPKLYIEVLGGVVQSVYSNAMTEVVLVDHDNMRECLKEDIESNLNLLTEFEQDQISSGFAKLAIG